MKDIEEVKQKTDIVALISEYVQLKRAGRNYKGLCPFHGEKSPSFMVNPDLQIYKCFGCQEGGDVFSFLQKIDGMTFGEALKHLATRAGITLSSYVRTPAEDVRERLISAHTIAMDAYHWMLTSHPLGKRALAYLAERGISSETISFFHLGYAPDQWRFLSTYLQKKKQFRTEELEAGGLAIAGKGYDRFRDRIMFPLISHSGQTVGFAGRIMPGSASTTAAKYMNTPETEIFKKGEFLFGLGLVRSDIKRAGEVVLVEGPVDALASWQAGVRQTVAVQGTALTPRQIQLLRRLTDTVILALDADVAGDSAARRSIELLEQQDMTIKVARWSGGKDPGELAISDPGAWKKIVAEAVPIYDFVLQSAVERHGLTGAGKKHIAADVLPLYGRIGDEIMKAHYLNLLANTLGVREDDVRSQLKKMPVEQGGTVHKPVAPAVATPAKRSRRDVLEEYVVGLALRQGKISELLALPNEWFTTSFWSRVKSMFSDAVAQDSTDLIAILPPEFRERVQNLFLVDEALEEDVRSWVVSVSQLEELFIREQLSQLATESGQENRMRQLTNRLSELTKNG